MAVTVATNLHLSFTQPGGQLMFPTEATTGTPQGWTPTTTLGATTLSTSGEVVEDTLFNGSVTVAAENVTLRRCRIQDGFIDNWPGATIQGGLLVEDCDMLRTPASADESDPPAIGTGNYTARNVKVIDYAEGFRAGGALVDGGGLTTIDGCWVRCIQPPGAVDWHGDAFQGFGDQGGTVLRWSYLFLQTGGTSPVFYPDQGNSNIEIDHVIAEGGGWSVVIGTTSQVTDLYVVENAWDFGPLDHAAAPAPADPFSAFTCTLDAGGQPVPVNVIVW